VRDVILSGENLAGTTNIILSGAPGISARIIAPPDVQVQVESSGAGVTSVARPNGNSLQVELSLDSDTALTDRELRVVSSEGVSNPLMIHVSHVPEIDATNNVSRETAQKIELPAAVSGTIQNAAESDFFSFTGKKGEHVVADVYAFRINSKLDSSLAVLDKSGKELARNEDAVGLDSVLDFEVPEDGEYLIELRDFRYQGGKDYKY